MGASEFEFELVGIVDAPIDLVFARLTDIDGYNNWMPEKGSILKRTEQTSPGPPSVGTTFVDDTTYGPTPGEIVAYDPPTHVIYHWWDERKNGGINTEGWPEFRLEAVDGDTTRVRHRARFRAHGVYRLGMPLLRRIAVTERTVTLDALKASFERP